MPKKQDTYVTALYAQLDATTIHIIQRLPLLFNPIQISNRELIGKHSRILFQPDQKQDLPSFLPLLVYMLSILKAFRPQHPDQL